MYNRVNAIKSGNWSDPQTWNGGVFPSVNDIVYCNGNIVLIDTNIEVKCITNDQTYIDVLGGAFNVIDNSVIKADIYSGIEPAISFTGEKLKIIGNIEGSSFLAGIPGITNNGVGTIEIEGNVKGGNCGMTYGIVNNNMGTISVTGNLYMGLGYACYPIYNTNNGTIIINGIESTNSGGYGGNS